MLQKSTKFHCIISLKSSNETLSTTDKTAQCHIPVHNFRASLFSMIYKSKSNNNYEFHIENWSLLSCYYIYSYVDCVHITCIILTLKVTPLKNFDIVDLQTFHRWFVGIFRINISKFISRAWVIDSRLPTKRNHSIFISY